VLERMGILEDVLKSKLPPGGDGLIVDAKGRKIGTTPAEFGGGEIEIPRGDLAQIIYRHTRKSCEYIFNDSISAVNETSNGVEVTFQNSAPRKFDLLVGADGIHSNVRGLVFGPESDFVHHLGYYYALVDINSAITKDDMMYNEPGRMASTGGIKAPAFFVFASNPLKYDRDNITQQKELLKEAYVNGGWKIPELMDQVLNSKEFYMDSISRVTAEQYSKGRTVLLGDAAYGNALGGFGTGLAIVGAYVLAGELNKAKDYKIAYAEYEAKFRGYAKVSQNVNAGSLLAPKTRLGLFLRNKLFSVAPLFKGVIKLIDYFASDIKLEDYSMNSNFSN
jgi:2-polyprenyl-6-methoxyphenol hydroxylase-like FAD-dependent oxidoreductase